MNDSTFGIIPIMRKEGRNYFLVVKSGAGHWGFPKGHPEDRETEYETAARELLEETGIRPIRIVPYPFSETRIRVESSYTLTKTVVWFIGYVAPGASVKIRDTDEILEYRWLHFDDAYALLSHEETRRVFLDARLYLSNHEIPEPEQDSSGGMV